MILPSDSLLTLSYYRSIIFFFSPLHSSLSYTYLLIRYVETGSDDTSLGLTPAGTSHYRQQREKEKDKDKDKDGLVAGASSSPSATDSGSAVSSNATGTGTGAGPVVTTHNPGPGAHSAEIAGVEVTPSPPLPFPCSYIPLLAPPPVLVSILSFHVVPSTQRICPYFPHQFLIALSHAPFLVLPLFLSSLGDGGCG